MADIAEHYNSIANKTVTRNKRRQLPTYPAREFNNLLKRRLLADVKKHVQPGCRILDLCCGRGGDIFKYNDLYPSFVKFLDISTTSIAEARRRYAEGVEKNDIKYAAVFEVADCFSAELGHILRDDNQYDVIICHFALHYAFRNMTSLCTSLTSVKRYLRPGGYFISSFPSYAALRDRARDEKTGQWRSFHNSVLRVDIPDGLTDENSVRFGVQYRFSLEDAVEECPEYLVPPDILTYYLEQFHLRPVLHCGFLEAAMHFGMMDKVPVDSELADVVSLYACLVAVNYCEQQAPPSPTDWSQNYRGRLQEYCQARGYPIPIYKEWPVNDWRQWQSEVQVVISGLPYACKSDPHVTKKQAQQEAAARMLEQIEASGTDTFAITNGDVTVEDITITAKTADMIVHVDADHISFVTPSLTECYRSVYFYFYFGHGADLGHLREFEKNTMRYKNVTLLRAQSPLKNLTDSMILIGAAQMAVQRPKIPQVVVSRDATVYNASVLLPFTFCVTDAALLNNILDNELPKV